MYDQETETSDALPSDITAGGTTSSTPTHTRARASDDVTYDEIATKLLNSNMLLTALEMHFELCEIGRELPRLRQFFSNPTNFEKALRVPNATDRRKQGSEPRKTLHQQVSDELTRSSSVATLDSLELARYSDDGSEIGAANNSAEERVIALEYELRKANDVIRNLRDELTRVALHRRGANEEVSSTATRNDEKVSSLSLPVIEFGDENESESENIQENGDNDQTMMAHEKRALNFLVNEYLLSQAFKLTSITLCEENASQDFDSWDDVGLNTARPPDLLTLYRHSTKPNWNSSRRNRVKREQHRVSEVQPDSNATDNRIPADKDKEPVIKVESQTQTDDLDAAGVATTQKCESFSVSVQVDDEETRNQVAQLESVVARLQNDLVKERQLSFLKGTPVASASCRNCDEKPPAISSDELDGDDRGATHQTGAVAEDADLNDSDSEVRTLSDLSPFQVALLRKLQPELSDWSKFESELKDLFDGGTLDNKTKHAVLIRLVAKFVSGVMAQNAAASALQQSSSSSSEQLSLANHEFVSLLLCAACLHPVARERDELLRALFTLTRRPDESVRRAVLTGCVLYAKLAGAKRIEEELFPQCCELMHNKFYEIRLLVVDASSILMPFLGSALCQSLVLSVLLGIFSTEKQLDVRIALLNAFAQLTLFLDEQAVDKFEQLHSVFASVIADRSTDGGESLALIAQRNLLPALAFWCARYDILHSHLAEKLLAVLDSTLAQSAVPVSVAPAGGKQRSNTNPASVVALEKIVLRLLKCIETLVPFLRYCALKQAEQVALRVSSNDGENEGEQSTPASENQPDQDVVEEPAQADAEQQPSDREAANEDGNSNSQKVSSVVTAVSSKSSFGGEVGRNTRLTNTNTSAVDLDLTAVDLLSLRLIAATNDCNNRLEQLEESYNRVIGLICADEEAERTASFSNSLANWPCLEWILNSFVPEYLRLVGKVNFSCCETVKSVCHVFQQFCRSLGRDLAMNKVKYRFAEMFSVTGDDINAEIAQGRTSLTTPLVTVYACGFLLAFYDEANAKCLCDFLYSVLCTLALCSAPLDSVCVTFVCLSKHSCCIEALLDTLWRAVTHSSAKLRCSAAQLFELLLKELDEAVITQKVLPGLITLANDPDVQVRICTIPVLGSVIEMVSNREVLEKCYMQLQSFLNDASHQHDYSLQLQLVRTIARVAPNAESRFCDAFVLPLAVLAAKNNQVTLASGSASGGAANSIVNLGGTSGSASAGANAAQNAAAALEKKRVMTVALLDAYTAVTCCVAMLNEQLIHTAVLPGLRCLHKDVLQVAAEHEASILNLIRELEAKVGSRNTNSSANASFSSSFSAASDSAASSSSQNAPTAATGQQSQSSHQAPNANLDQSQSAHFPTPGAPSTPSGANSSSRSAAVLNRLMDLTGKSAGGGLFKRNK